MDVSGRGASARPGTQHEQGSDEYNTGHQCKQCQEDERSVAADGYCVDCGHYLCCSCIKLHRRLVMSKNHTVFTGEDMPHQKPQASGSVQCSKHPGKPIELYCGSDDTLGCYLCFTIGHKSCQNIRPISDLSKNVESSEELKDIIADSKQHDTTVELYRKLIAECHVVNNTCYDKSLDDFQSFRAKIESLLDRLGEAVRTEAGLLRDTNKKKLDSLSEEITSLDKEMVSFMTEIKLKQKLKQTDQLFFAIKANMKSIKDKVKNLQHLKKDILVRRYVLHKYSPITQGLEKMIKTAIQEVSTDAITCKGKINVASPDDKKVCFITGMADISSTRMVVTDSNNQCIKLIDVDQSTIITKRSLRAGPFDVAVIPGSRLTVAVPDLQQLQFFTTDTGLKPCGHIAQDGRCISVASIGDRLVVGYMQPPKVQIIYLSGQVLKSFTTDLSGIPLFGVPRYLSLSPDHTSIFISDWQNKNVTRMSTEGVIEWVFMREDLQYPVGVATGHDGCLYICSRDTHTLHVVSAAGVRHMIVPVDQFQLQFPRAICYNKDQAILYVSSISDNPAHRNFIRRLTLQ